MESTTGIVVDGIIGWDTVRQFDLTMNYSAEKVIIREPRVRDFIDGREQNPYWLGKPSSGSPDSVG